MRYSSDFETLGLPENFKFGIELEAYNVKTKGKNSLYTGDSAEYIKGKKWKMASKKEESLVGHGGAELVSPILHDTAQDWANISSMCEQMKKYSGTAGDKVVADEKCGLHVHFDADCVAKNPKTMENFLRLYAESEELIYKMCNDKNNPIRKGAMNKNYKGLNLISSIWRKGMAAPSGKKILEKIDNGTLKLSYKKYGRLKSIAGKYKLDERRYRGLNLTNIGNSKKNTIEFRMANGTLDPAVIKQNVFLYASLLKTSIQMTECPDMYKGKLEDFYRTNISEQEKAEKFLSLIMDNSSDRHIYMDRWNSVKDNKAFEKNDRKGFAEGRFKKEQFKSITSRVSFGRFDSACETILSTLKNLTKGGSAYGR